MLVNGTTLGYRAVGGSGTYTDLAGLKEVPDLGAEPEMVDNTALTDSVVHNEQGIGDAGDMQYTFRYDIATANTAYRLCNASGFVGAQHEFQHALSDGTTFTFTAIPSIRLSGGGVNDPQEFTLTLALQSDITVTIPAVA